MADAGVLQMYWFPLTHSRRLHALQLLLMTMGSSLLAAQGKVVVARNGTTQEPAAEAKAAAVRAAFLFKIATYLSIDAPAPSAEKRSHYRIGVLGDDPLIATGRRVWPGKQVGDATVQVVTIELEDAVAGRAAEHCELLYVGASVDDEDLAKVVSTHARKAMPVVCERGGFAQGGGAIQLFVEDKGMRFEVNAETLRRQGVRASPQLLKHSRRGPGR